LNSAGNATFANVSITSALNVGGVATFSAGTAAAPSITTTGDTNTGIFFPAADTIAFTEGGVEAMRIDSSGQVGIGTSSPAYKLDVRGSGNIISWSDGTTPGVLYSAASYFGLTNSAQTNGFFVNPSGAFCTIATGGSERARIDSSGNLGIGTSSPTEKLHVAGALRVTGAQTTAGTGVYLDQTSGTGGVSVYGPDNSTQGTFRIYTATANGGTGSTKLTLDTSGNLGLGVTPSAWNSAWKAIQAGNGAAFQGQNNSASVVHVSGNAYIDSGGVYRYIGTEGAQRYRGYEGAHEWFTAASGTAGNAISFTQAMTLTAAGALLVGTTTASNRILYTKGAGVNNEYFSSFENTNSSTPLGLDIFYSAVAPNSTGSQFLDCRDTGATRLQLRSNGGLANYSANDVNLSDERTKKDIVPLGSMWDKFKAIEIVAFKYKDQTHEDNNIGVIAQQVESVAPEFVDVDGFGDTPEDGVPLKTVYTTDMYHAAIKALQEAMTRIEQLEAKVAALESK
jgi:hypothetical protein